jgi:hypothetical protein
MEKLSHKLMTWSAVTNTVITTLSFFFFVFKVVAQ